MIVLDILRFLPSFRLQLATLSIMLMGLLAACSGPSAASTSKPASALASGSVGTSPSRSSPAAAGSAAAGGSTARGIVSWIHIGDLHIQTADMQNYKDFQTILGLLNQVYAGGSDFALLPGDNANEGSDAEFQLIGQAIKAANLKMPLYAVQGDHDNKSSNQSFQQYLYPKTYYSQDIGGYHFAFVNAMAQSGDTSLTAGSAEMTWLQQDLSAANSAGKKSVLVLHPFFFNNLADLADVQKLVQQDNVILVDAGHTHTNQLANDGQTDYAACRSTGQATEGPVGVCVETLDAGIFSWKFEPLGQFPFVEITSPGDEPLINSAAGLAHGTVQVHARAFDTSPIASATYQIDEGAQVAMAASSRDLWTAAWDSTQVSDGAHKLTVTVRDQAGKTATDVITTEVKQSGTYTAPASKVFGPGANVISSASNALLAAKGLVTAGSAGSGAGPGGGSKGPKGGPGGPHGTATVASISGNRVTLKLANGTTTTVTLGSGVQLLKQVPASSSDLSAGVTVQLVGAPGQTTPSELVIMSTGSATRSASAPTSARSAEALGGLVLVLLLGAAVLAALRFLPRRRPF